jgi:hypothetical protein
VFTMFPAGNGGTVELVYMQVRELLFTFASGTLLENCACPNCILKLPKILLQASS